MFRGSIVALVTPFTRSLDVDFDALGRLIDWQIEQGTDAIVPCGTTGEAPTLSHDEQKQCIKFTMERVAGRVPVIAGTGSNSTREAVGLTKYAREAGAAAALLITPYYNKPSAAGLIAHYSAVAEAVDIPMILYNVPSRTGVNMLPATVAEIRKQLPNVVAVKEASGNLDQVSQILSQCDITVLSGDDSLTLPMMSVGAAGVISVVANVAPKKMHELCALANAGDYAGARKLHYELLPLFKGMFIETNPMPVKAALASMGMIEPALRLPLTPVLPESQVKIDGILKGLGIL